MNGVKRSVSFLLRAGGIYLGYKGAQVSIGTSAVFWKWSTDREADAWAKTNDRAGRQVRALAEEFEGYYLKSAQWLGSRPDLVPAEWITHLAPLQDRCPPMDSDEVQALVQWELLDGKPLETTFARFDAKPLGSASIAQVHSARLTESAARAAGAQRQRQRLKHGPFSGLRSRWSAVGRRSVRREVVVKVQRPGAKQLVLRDLATLHTFANLVGRDISWDVDMVMTEVMSRVKSEFDFHGEAAVQDAIADMFAQPPPHRRASHRLLAARVKAKEQLDRLPLGGSVGPIGSLLAVGLAAPLLTLHAAGVGLAHVSTLGGALTYTPPVAVPRSVPGLCTPSCLVMERCEGVTLAAAARTLRGTLGVGSDSSASGDSRSVGGGLSGWLAARRQRQVAKAVVAALAEAFGRMALEPPGIVHGDPHPGNILLAIAGLNLATPETMKAPSVRALVGKPTVGLIDWGQITTLEPERRRALAALIVAMTAPHKIASSSSSGSEGGKAAAGCAVGEALEALGLEFEGRKAVTSLADSLPSSSTGAAATKLTQLTGKRPWADETATRIAAASALATHFFDTLPVAKPFAGHPLDAAHPLRTLKCATFPSDLFLLVRAVQILKALAEEADVADGWSLAELWRPHAQALLLASS